MQSRRFNLYLIIHFISLVLLIEALFFAGAVIVSFIYREAQEVKMASTFLLLFLPGLLLFFGTHKKPINNLTRKESILIVSLGWLIMSLLGSVPYITTGAIPHFSNAFFESMSGFTTTGSSILTDIEALPKSILFWRSETHWIGGMGIIVLIVALAPVVVNNGVYLYSSEMSNVVDERLMTQIKYFARNIWLVYVGLTFLEIAVLSVAGMPFFDSICHSFATIATGGFSTKNASLAAYSPAIQYIVMVFMLLSGMNFMLHVLAIRGKFKKVFRNEELRLYLLIVLVVGMAITFGLYFIQDNSFEESFRTAFFQVISVITATGFATADYLIWPSFALLLILVLMLIGASAGSTGGGVKVIRNLIALKKAGLSIKQMIYPNAVQPLRYNGQVLKSQQVASVIAFILLYYFIVGICTLILMLLGLDKSTSLGAVLTTMGGIGPGFGTVGPAANFAHLPEAAKYLLTVVMVLGRLEIYPVLILFTAWYWKNN